MQKRYKKRTSLLILCMVLSMTFFITGCQKQAGGEAPEPAEQAGTVQSDGGVLGEGSKEFAFSVMDQDGNETKFEIHTDKESVGEALQELGLIDGEEGEYGLFVKTVNGITADYDADGVYWAFYINGEYANSGIDVTKITEGDSYALKVE